MRFYYFVVPNEQDRHILLKILRGVSYATTLRQKNLEKVYVQKKILYLYCPTLYYILILYVVYIKSTFSHDQSFTTSFYPFRY